MRKGRQRVQDTHARNASQCKLLLVSAGQYEAVERYAKLRAAMPSSIKYRGVAQRIMALSRHQHRYSVKVAQKTSLLKPGRSYRMDQILS